MRGDGIQEIMENYGFSEEELMKEHKKVIRQNKNLSAKNTAIDMAYKLKGIYPPSRTETKNLNIDMYTDMTQGDIEHRMKEILEELGKLGIHA